MKREESQVNASSFTTVSALVREILALLAETDYKLEIIITPNIREQLDNELESVRTLGRVKVKQNG
jgi:hypothetical protein